MNCLGIARADVIKASLARSSSKIEDFDSFDEAWLIIALPHVRERTIIKAVGKKLERIVILERPDGLATQVEIGDERLSTTVVGLKRDWIAVWLLMLVNYSPKRLFILASIDDFCFMPLKAHLFKENIAFDSQDPMGEYAADAFRKQLAIWNYKFGVRYIVRDPRFKASLRRSRNRKAAICYMPDAPIFETIGKTEVQRKFRDVEKIRFVSSGWVSAEGDEGVPVYVQANTSLMAKLRDLSVPDPNDVARKPRVCAIGKICRGLRRWLRPRKPARRSLSSRRPKFARGDSSA